MSPDFVAYDTWKEAKKMFRFDSGSLDYITKYLGVSRKLDTGGSSLWTQVVFDKNKKSLAKMVTYCNGDVVAQSEVFAKMKPYLKSKSNIADFVSDCPECGSENTTVSKRRKTAAGHRKVQFVCADCGRYHTVSETRYEKDAAI
jgi:predicted RNA-binding Zn-ribbon protein involved in translation (DUF1610 family)